MAVSNQPAHHPQRLRDRLAGQHLLVTGSTGFLAKVFVEKLLRSVDTIGGIHLLVRPKPDGTPPMRRVWQTVLSSSVFDRLRAALGDGFTRLCEEKIHVVDGDLTKQRLGLDRALYHDLAQRITMVVNSAATVTFDERLDLAVELNTLGPTRLLQFARDAGNIPFLHVSTCYVCGVRTGVVVEDMSAPEAARESLPRIGATGDFDFDALVESMLGEAAELRHRFAADQEACRRQLIEAGMSRARASGWNDTYTFTKWIGEQLLARDRGSVPLVIFRPAIIEGSYDEPTPGWIDGLRMADPIIVAHGRGKLDEFPARKDIPLDLIPVDFVANAMIAALPHGKPRPPQTNTPGARQTNGKPSTGEAEVLTPAGTQIPGGLTVVQCGSSDRNPMMIREISSSLYKAFRKRPMNDDEGKPIYPAPLRLVDIDLFQKKWERRKRQLLQIQRIVKAVSPRGRRLRRINATLRQVEQLLYFAKIYSPYTHLNTRFADDTLRAAAERLHPDDRVLFPFDVERIDWEDYLVNRHVPGLRSFVLGTGGEPSGRLRAEVDLSGGERTSAADALQATNLFEVFQRAARRYRQKPALQIRRNNRWLRYTYDEVLQATGTIMLRFVERGLSRGDRIAICAENGPEWGLTYFAAMRAGLTTIPIDPELPAREVWASARFASAKLMCAGGKTFDALCAAKHESDAEVVKLREPFIPAPGASRDRLPDPVPLDDSAIASILFTSGTTVLPKAVPLTHRNLIANAKALVQVHPIDASDELLSVLPMYHAFEFTAGFLVPVVSGATITYVEQLKGAEIMSAMQATGTTIMLVVPRLLRLFNDSIENNVANSGILTRVGFRLLRLLSDLSGRRMARPLFRSVRKKFGGHLSMFVCGGSRLDPDLFHAFERMGFKVYEGYGLTETAPVLTVNPPGDSRPSSVGRPLPNVEMEIRNATLDGIGEVWVRGPNVMAGYLGNDDATREVVQGGWFRTGDLGRTDEDGYLYLTGRSKDLIITGAGKNVYPDEVEALYRDLPYVAEMCVFGMTAPDGLGDAVHAVIVIDREAAPDMDRSSIEREIRLAAEDIGETLPPHQRISSIHFWDRELPRTSTMKAKRGLIRDIVNSESAIQAGDAVSRRERSLEEETIPDSQNQDAWLAVRDILARQSKTPPSSIRPNMHLQLDLGIDSIGRLEVIGAVEARFNMRIDNDAGAGIARVADLLKLIGPRKPAGARPAETRSNTAGAWQRRLEADGKRENGAGFDGRVPGSLMPMRWLVRGTVSALMHSYVRVRGHGMENIPEQGPFLLAANHSSHLDTPSVLTALGGKRRVWTAGAEDYFFGTRLRRLVFGQLLDTIPFDRHSDGVTGLRRCGQALKLGDGLLLFPEGTRSLNGTIQPFKIGIAVLAIERGVPIIPVYIHRAHDLMPKGSRFARPGLVTVAFGEPIHPPSRKEITDYYAAFQELTCQVEQAVRALAEGVPN
jgi:long-chain acyl-CoA synthetase